MQDTLESNTKLSDQFSISALSSDTADLFDRIGHETVVPELFRSVTDSKQKFTLTSRCWRVTSPKTSATAKLVLIEGHSSVILNAWVFPDEPSIIPTFAAEILATGDRPKLAFIDFQTAGLVNHRKHTVERAAEVLSRRFQELLSTEPPPDWATAFSSGGYFYSKAPVAGGLATIRQIHLSYLRDWISFFTSADEPFMPSAEQSATAKRILQDYKHHHAEHTPGKEFLSRIFGNGWSDAFFSSFLFH